MLLCIIFSVLTCFLTVTCQTDQQCRLEVSNKTAFENKIVDYIKEDATFMIIEYNLTITSNGNLSDWYNISDPFSIEPWRWYRAKGANMTRLLLMYNKILFGHLLFFDTFADIPVNLVDHPSGCLANISTADMYSFIMRAVVKDFGVRFENLRTSEKLYQNPYVCTSRRDELTESKYKWCCKRDLHDDIVCEAVQEHSIALILIYIFAAVVVWLLFLYSPYLLQADKRLIYESVSLEGFLPIQPSTSAASPNADSSKTDDPNADSSKTDSPKADSSKADSSKADCSKDDSSKDYSLMSDSSKADSSKHDLPKTYCLSYDSSKADSPIADSPKTDSPKAGSSKDYSSKDDTSKDDSSKADTSNKPSNKTDLKFRIKLNSYYEKDQPLPFGIFDLLRSYNCCGGNEDNSEKCCDGNCCRIYVRNNFPCSTVVRRLSVVFFFFVFPAIVLFIRYVSVSEMPVITSFVFLFIIYVSFYASMATICFERTAHAYTRSFNALSETKFSKFCNIPMVTIISSPWISREKLNRESTEKTIECDGANCIILFLSLIATVPACALTFVLVTAVVVIMYRVTFIYTIVSGIAAFLVYLREKVNEVRKQHERCLKIITEKIEDYITASNMTKADKNIYLYNEDKPLHNWSPREGLVTVKGCIPFLVLDRGIYIKDSVLFHFLHFEQKKLLCYLFMAAGFIAIIILLVIFINSMDFISPSIQVLVTVFTSIIPLLLKIAFSKGHNDCTLFFDTEEFKKKIESYEEQFKMVTDKETHTESNPQPQTQQDNSGNTGEVSQSQKSNADERAKSSSASGGDIEQGLSDKRKKAKITDEMLELDEVHYSNEKKRLLPGDGKKYFA